MSIVNSTHNTTDKGFTVIEFIVILSIFAIMSSVALFNFRGFNREFELSDVAIDVALEMKTAQTIGSSAFGGTSDSARVVSMVFPVTGGRPDNQFTTYREVGSKPTQTWGLYDPGSDVLLRDNLLGGTFGMRTIQWCKNEDSCNDLSRDVFISFQRPNPDPIVTSQACNDIDSVLVDGFSQPRCQRGFLRIELGEPGAAGDDGPLTSIIMEESGQIRIE